MAKVMMAYIKCPLCDQRVDLYHMKDFESYSQVEVQRHYQARHPELLKDDNVMPYIRIQFEMVEVLREQAQTG